MPITRLPARVPPASNGWRFTGPWTADERAIIEHILCERIPNVGRAQADPWSFLLWEGAESDNRYYAHCPGVHPTGVGYARATAEDLADDLWDHYFTLHLGPLGWSIADLPDPRAADFTHQFLRVAEQVTTGGDIQIKCRLAKATKTAPASWMETGADCVSRASGVAACRSDITDACLQARKPTTF
jgi:hypothetical protein